MVFIEIRFPLETQIWFPHSFFLNAMYVQVLKHRLDNLCFDPGLGGGGSFKYDP